MPVGCWCGTCLVTGLHHIKKSTGAEACELGTQVHSLQAGVQRCGVRPVNTCSELVASEARLFVCTFLKSGASLFWAAAQGNESFAAAPSAVVLLSGLSVSSQSMLARPSSANLALSVCGVVQAHWQHMRDMASGQELHLRGTAAVVAFFMQPNSHTDLEAQSSYASLNSGNSECSPAKETHVAHYGESYILGTSNLPIPRCLLACMMHNISWE